jgi:hypothetical protein
MDTTRKWKPSEKLLKFCSSRFARRGCFGSWSIDHIAEYLTHHAEQNTLAVVWEQGEVMAVGTGIQCDMWNLNTAYLVDRKDGKCLFLEVIIVRHPDCFCDIFAAMFQRWPYWRDLQIVGRRDEQITTYDSRIIEKLLARGARALARVDGLLPGCDPYSAGVPGAGTNGLRPAQRH